MSKQRGFFFFIFVIACLGAWWKISRLSEYPIVRYCFPSQCDLLPFSCSRTISKHGILELSKLTPWHKVQHSRETSAHKQKKRKYLKLFTSDRFNQNIFEFWGNYAYSGSIDSLIFRRTSNTIIVLILPVLRLPLQAAYRTVPCCRSVRRKESWKAEKVQMGCLLLNIIRGALAAKIGIQKSVT